jgi:putative transposase
MKEDITKPVGDATGEELFDDWFDPIEKDVGTTVRGFIETMIEEELAAALWRPRYGRRLTPTEPRAIVTAIAYAR